jgi:cell division protein FtsB
VPDQRRGSGYPRRRPGASRTPHSGRTGAEQRRARTPKETIRPASARQPATPRPAKRTPAPAPGGRFTGRAATLSLVLIVLLLAYAYPMRLYLSQQAQIAALESSQNAQRARIQEKQTQIAKWNDKDYIIAMAHKRLQMVLPGDRVYVVVPAPGATGPAADPHAGQATNTGPWYGKLWSSVQAADKPGAGP